MTAVRGNLGLLADRAELLGTDRARKALELMRGLSSVGVARGAMLVQLVDEGRAAGDRLLNQRPQLAFLTGKERSQMLDVKDRPAHAETPSANSRRIACTSTMTSRNASTKTGSKCVPRLRRR